MSDRDFWVGAARRLALRRNVAAWTDALLPVVLGLTVVAALALLVLRVMGLETRFLWYSYLGAVGLAGVVCAAVAGRRPFTLSDSLARLDEVGRLHNRLTAAHSGIGEWPGRRAGIRDSVTWNWVRLGVPVLIGGMLLGASAMVELPRYRASARPNEEPIAWTRLESWLQKLEQAKVLDPPALEKLKEQVDDLRKQPDQSWYSQSSLEAGDALEQQTGQSLRSLEENLEKSSELVGQAQQAGGESASELKALSASMQNAAEALQWANLPANKELTGMLKSFDPSTLKTMSAAQMQALQQKLNAGAGVCSQCVGPNRDGAKSVAGNGHQTGDRATGQPGGGGPAQLGLDQQPENLHSKRLEGASNDDPTRALPGEVIAIAKGKHNVDTTTQAGAQGGAISGAGEGGDAVWRDSLTPEEQGVLQRYFK